MKKKLVPICAMALLSVGYSSVASASTGTMTKEEVAQVQQDTTKKEAAMQEQQKQDKMKKEAAVQEQQKQDKMKKEGIQEQQKQDQMKKEAAVQATKGEKLPNTASNSIIMMTLSACLVALGSLFGFTRRKIKA
ncbi:MULTISPECIES: LPXTG cell wall anchor domain-containing protein [Bacillus]|uniref:Cell surface protein n=1 Tax=Bacillus pseudomycoides TaxID=64104 RepID=A0A1Y3MHB7_9BACI|nr:LPXTG cell wall anchor domain-containing protein [Bacillus pseudomycoides]EOP49118.1 LPXTG-domain-containing protein cell wall anchor domain [Bacillus cereus VD136]EOQ01607.1 LPXTG-domain-containing protein cell wall anchor domain [Bacillus cereus VDM021]MDF2086227.1 LPXTG cell wall anchor domain-containing protein [Bacillus pseudomycoides]OUM47002.1 cell surface protein [Bacillus pseudomycoides]PEK63083.1 cell surface protein [Bacillus pseudomycoides]